VEIINKREMNFRQWCPFLFISSLFLSVRPFSLVFKLRSKTTGSAGTSSCRLGPSSLIEQRRRLAESRSFYVKTFLLPSLSKWPSQCNNTYSKDRRSRNEGLQVLGICGGIASGKSKACQILVSHPNITNCIVGYIDADQLAHKLYDNDSSPLLQHILREFGPNVFTSTNSTNSKLQLDRKALGNIVFANPERMSVSWKNNSMVESSRLFIFVRKCH